MGGSGADGQMDIGVVTYEGMTPQFWKVSGLGPACQSGV